jgi:DeoR/GlpR family transcriptional regulator of sugar metabolism
MSPGRALRPAQRRDQIAELVVARGAVTAQDLAQEFDVSVMTVHRDLDDLEQRGILRKSRGIATAQPSGVFESTVAYRLKANLPQKQLVAKHAARFVEPGMSVMLDDSTTALQMLPHLEKLTPLKVATNFMEVLRRLAGASDVGLIAIGGDYDPQHDSFLGVACLEAIDAIRVDATFLSTSAASGALAFHQEQQIVSFKRAMLDAATRRYLLLDHTKVGRTALYRLVPLADFDAVVVDPGAPAEILDEFRQHGAKVEVATHDPPQ